MCATRFKATQTQKNHLIDRENEWEKNFKTNGNAATLSQNDYHRIAVELCSHQSSKRMGIW